jgi:hypothetical protein
MPRKPASTSAPPPIAEVPARSRHVGEVPKAEVNDDQMARLRAAAATLSRQMRDVFLHEIAKHLSGVNASDDAALAQPIAAALGSLGMSERTQMFFATEANIGRCR